MFGKRRKTGIPIKIEKGTRFILIDTEGKGYCPFYTKYLANHPTTPKRGVQTLTPSDKGTVFLTTREPNHKISRRDIVFQLHLLKDYCEDNNIEYAYMPMWLWTRDGHNMLKLSFLVSSVFRGSKVRLIY